MKIGKIPTRHIHINPYTPKNKQIPLLYNHILDIVQIEKLPAVFHTDKIELPRATSSVIKQLRKLGIRWRTVEK